MKKISLLTTILSVCFFLASGAWASDDTTKMIEEGNRIWSENKTEEAEASFRKAIEAEPESAKAYERLGALLLMQTKNEEAVAAYQEAIIRNPGNAKNFAALSIAYLHMGYHRMAQSMAKQAVELDPDMKHAQDITKYIDAKLKHDEQVALTEGHSSKDPHNNVISTTEEKR